jgi:sulfotransferase family protein
VNKQLFLSGTARGGTNLITMLLSVHPDIQLAQDPYLPLFKSFRNTVIRNSNKTELENFDPKMPLDEYYYLNSRLTVMKLIQNSDLCTSLDKSERSELLKSLKDRMKLSSPLLIPFIDELQGENYKELFESAVKIVGKVRSDKKTEWLGFNDNWAVEFFTPLARRFPNARFVIIVRDVRSSIASHLRVDDPMRKSLPLSFVRCWRKQIAFAKHFEQMKLFDGRLHVISYEQVVKDPEKYTKMLCEFLEIEFVSDMLNTSNFVGPNGENWIPNSNFKVPQQGIYQDSIDRWKKSLAAEMINLIEFVAGPDLKLAGYELKNLDSSETSIWDAYRQHVQDSDKCQGWRTDNLNSEIDFGFELLRQYCLKERVNNQDLIEKCFLFPEVYDSLCGEQNIL